MNIKTFIYMILTFRRVDPIPKNIGLMLSTTFWISIVWIISNFTILIMRLTKKYACRDWDGRGSTQWKSFPTQSPICRGNDGLPFNVDNLTIPYGKWRKESIKAYGNAIVPLIAVKIFEMINKIERYEQQTTL